MFWMLIDWLIKRKWFYTKRGKWCPAQSMIDANYADDLVLLQINLPKLNPCCMDCKWHEALASKWMQMRQFMCYKEEGAISKVHISQQQYLIY